MKKLIKILLLSIFCIASLKPQTKNSTTKENTHKEDIRENSRLDEAYKLLYENAKESNEQIVSTLQWVVGVSIAFLLAILGSQIFFNWRVNKKDIDYIKKDLEKKLSELKSQLIKDIAGTNKDQEEKISKVFEKLEKDFLARITTEFEKTKNILNIRQEINTVKTTSLKTQMENDVKTLKADIQKNAGDIWKVRGVDANALASYLNTALLEMELGHEVKYTLDEIIVTLGSLSEIHELDYTNLDRIISELKASHKGQKDKIISLYKDKPVYRFLPTQNYFGFAERLGLSSKKYVKNEPKP